jgi:hypothetical protein
MHCPSMLRDSRLGDEPHPLHESGSSGSVEAGSLTRTPSYMPGVFDIIATFSTLMARNIYVPRK